ncbi:PITH domain-containing protein [Podospora appendiculata]|uniref:PITH domain-containing protein n=1 Tax=Podospora appendiculata TaxID=314037 RepID=A0AAE1C9L4_9PEZI|nr:PITH domain-containing protein [Podospora appendiculata]
MSGHCHDEHDGHNHGGDGAAAHDHSDDITPAVQFSLYQQINFDEITTFNEAQYGSGRAVCKKTWAERLSAEPELASDADEQLLMNIPFTAQIKLHSILLRTSDSDSAPRTLKVLINRDDVDFSVAEDAPGTQTFELSRTSEVQELPVKRARFSSVRRLSLFFADNFGDGDEDVTDHNIVYEAAANPSDHKVKGTEERKVGGGLGR